MAGEKRSQERENAQHEQNIVLVDIEGTTTSISFVKETLFPYIRTNLKDYIERKWDDAEFKEDVEKLKEQAKNDGIDKIEGLIDIKGETPEESKTSLMKNILWQMDNDRKTGALKQLQGHMWREAYKTGAIKGHLYEDVPKAFEAWTKNGRKIYIYSSGSVEAQRLLFGYSEHGDLRKFLSGYFDTEVGTKQESASYKNIITKIGCETSNVLFLTDVVNEAKAAIESGMASVIVAREGNEALTAEEKSKYTIIQSFQDLIFQTATKRQKIEDTSETKKDELKKVEESKETITEPMDTADNGDVVSNNDVKVEKETKSKATVADDSKQENKPTDDAPAIEIKKDVTPMECEAATETEKLSKEKESDDTSTKKVSEVLTTCQASISEVDSKVTETKVDEKVESKSETSTLNIEENKTESVNKVNETSKNELKTVTDLEKSEVKTNDKTKESIKSEDTSKVDEKVDVKESVGNKLEEKTADQKTTVVEEKIQNGDSKSEATESTSKTNTTAVTEVNGGVKNENSNVTAGIKDSAKEKVTAETVKTDAVDNVVPTKSEPTKEEEKSVEEVVGKKLNGNTPTDENDSTAEKAHRNGVNEEKKQNGDGESTTDKESIKVKKVVDSIADGVGEPDVVSPVAVVAATS